MKNDLKKFGLEYWAINEGISATALRNEWYAQLVKILGSVENLRTHGSPGFIFDTMTGAALGSYENPSFIIDPQTNLVYYGAVIFRMKESYIEFKIEVDHFIPVITTCTTLGNGEFNQMMKGEEVMHTKTEHRFMDEKAIERLKFTVDWFLEYDKPCTD